MTIKLAILLNCPKYKGSEIEKCSKKLLQQFSISEPFELVIMTNRMDSITNTEKSE